MGRNGLFVARALGIAVLVAVPVAAQTFVTVQTLPIQTTTMTPQQLLTDGKNGKSTIIAGELRIPAPPDKTDRFPAVIIAPGLSGPATPLQEWAQIINNIGIATFMLDSFAGRGFLSSPLDRVSLYRLNGVVDAYRALALLADHPRIDRSRVAVMGFSWGGPAGLYSSLERFTNMYAPSTAQFAAHIVVYPGCDTTFHDDTKTTGKPIRLFHGAADDWTPVAPCRDYVKRLKSAGADVALTELPDALHAYDWSSLSTTVSLPEARSLRACSLEEGDNGAVLNGKTGKVFTREDPCIEKGVHMGYNAAAYQATVKGVKQFLRETFNLTSSSGDIRK
jgi:dienelactone hydrolase